MVFACCGPTVAAVLVSVSAPFALIACHTPFGCRNSTCAARFYVLHWLLQSYFQTICALAEEKEKGYGGVLRLSVPRSMVLCLFQRARSCTIKKAPCICSFVFQVFDVGLVVATQNTP
jgi:hypothetical protein